MLAYYNKLNTNRISFSNSQNCTKVARGGRRAIAPRTGGREKRRWTQNGRCKKNVPAATSTGGKRASYSSATSTGDKIVSWPTTTSTRGISAIISSCCNFAVPATGRLPLNHNSHSYSLCRPSVWIGKRRYRERGSTLTTSCFTKSTSRSLPRRTPETGRQKPNAISSPLRGAEGMKSGLGFCPTDANTSLIQTSHLITFRHWNGHQFLLLVTNWRDHR